MKLKNLSIATALLLALTGCGSSGGGNSDNSPTTPNNEIQNNQTTQNQANAQQAELDRLKAQLSQAQNEKQTAEDKLKQAEQLSAQDSNKAKAGLHKAQEELAAAQKALDEKLSLEKILTRDEVFQFALHNGLNTVDSSEFADNFKNNSKSFVTEQLVEVHKIIALKRLARSYSLSEDEVRNFVNANKDKTLNEARTLLNGKRTERENLINELTALAKQKGLEEWEARSFAYANVDNDKANALENLNQLVAEKEKHRLQAEKEQKIRDLVEQYRNNYFSDASQYDFYQALGDYQGKSLDEVKQELDNLKSNLDEIAELAKPLADYDENADNYFIRNNAFVSIEQAKQNLEKEKNRIIEYKKNLYSFDSSGNRLGEIIPEGFTAKYNLHTKQEPIIEDGFETGKKDVTRYLDIYNQKYSVIVGNYVNDAGKETYTIKDPKEPVVWEFKDSSRGIETKSNNFSTEGRATYEGVAFDAKAQGKLSYTVDFAQRTGSGKITGLEHIGNITLEEGKILKLSDKDAMGVQGKAIANDWNDVDGKYIARFFGPQGEEIAGKATLDQTNYELEGGINSSKQIRDVTLHNKEETGNNYRGGHYRQDPFDIGFGGTRGEIQK